MKTIFKLFSLYEERVITGAWLSSDGVQTESELTVIRKHIADFDSEFDAIEFLATQIETPSPEHGYEIIQVLTIKK